MSRNAIRINNPSVRAVGDITATVIRRALLEKPTVALVKELRALHGTRSYREQYTFHKQYRRRS
jgi:hypothetical protein